MLKEARYDEGLSNTRKHLELLLVLLFEVIVMSAIAFPAYLLTSNTPDKRLAIEIFFLCGFLIIGARTYALGARASVIKLCNRGTLAVGVSYELLGILLLAVERSSPEQGDGFRDCAVAILMGGTAVLIVGAVLRVALIRGIRSQESERSGP